MTRSVAPCRSSTAPTSTLRVDMSVEGEDVEGAYAGAQRRGLEILYPMTDEPWAIRRFAGHR